MTETSEDEDALAWLDFIVPDEPRVPRASRALHHPPPSPVFSPHPLLAALDSLVTSHQFTTLASVFPFPSFLSVIL